MNQSEFEELGWLLRDLEELELEALDAVNGKGEVPLERVYRRLRALRFRLGDIMGEEGAKAARRRVE